MTVLVLLCLGVWIVASVSVVNAEPEDYDTNGNGILEKDEVLAVVIDYFRDEITKDEVLEVLVLYFLRSAEPEPTATPTPTPDSQGLRPQSEWTVDNPATFEEIEAELQKYRGGSLVFASWGEAYETAQNQAYISFFEEQFGVEIVTETMNYAILRTQVETRNLLWQILGYDEQAAWQAATDGYLEGLDFSIVGDQASMEVDRSPYFICWTCGHMINADSWSIPRGLKAQNPYAFELANLFMAWASGTEKSPTTSDAVP